VCGVPETAWHLAGYCPRSASLRAELVEGIGERGRFIDSERAAHLMLGTDQFSLGGSNRRVAAAMATMASAAATHLRRIRHF